MYFEDLQNLQENRYIVPIAFLTMVKNRLLHFQGVDTKAVEILKIWGAKSN